MRYADQNYDPKAAHDYYIKHRKLKGRKKRRKSQEKKSQSTSQSPDIVLEVESVPGEPESDSTAQSTSSQYQLTDAAKESIRQRDRTSIAGLNDAGKQAAKNVKANLQAERKAKADAIAADAKAMISALRESLKGMSKEEKAANKERIQQQIESIRNDVKAAKEALKQEYDDKYVAELSNIKMNPEFQNERSNAGLTDEGKQRAKALKDNLAQQRREEQSKIAEDVKQQIAQLRSQYKIQRGMSDAQKERIREFVKSKVETLRAGAKAAKQQIKDKYDGMYMSGLSDLKKDRSLMRGVE